MSHYFLTHEDFSIQKSDKGPILCLNIPGYSMVLFYSNSCEHCPKYLSIFKRLPTLISGCNICTINVGKDKSIVQMAKQTIAPLKYVPFIVFYNNMVPVQEYTGAPDENIIKRFIIDMATTMQRKQQVLSREKKEESKSDSIPAYCIGKPVSGSKKDEVCYLADKEAYKPKM